MTRRLLSLLAGGPTLVLYTCRLEMYPQRAVSSKCAFVMCIASGMGRLSVTVVTTMCLASYNSLVSSHRSSKKEFRNMTDLMQTKRRQLLKGAGVLSALGALTALGQPMAAFADSTGQGPEGSWL